MYNAKLNVFPDDAVKLCIALKASVLNVLHTADLCGATVSKE